MSPTCTIKFSTPVKNRVYDFISDEETMPSPIRHPQKKYFLSQNTTVSETLSKPDVDDDTIGYNSPEGDGINQSFDSDNNGTLSCKSKSGEI